MSPRKPPDLPHPDEVTGALSGSCSSSPRRRAIRWPSWTSIAGCPRDDLFPAPTGTPDARVTTRWRVPGIVSEDIVFPSQHEPIEPGFRERYLTEYPETHTVYARRIRPAVVSRPSAAPLPARLPAAGDLGGGARVAGEHGPPARRRGRPAPATVPRPPYPRDDRSAASPTGPPTWCAASRPCGRTCSTRVRCSVGCRPSTPTGRRHGAQPGRSADPCAHLPRRPLRVLDPADRPHGPRRDARRRARPRDMRPSCSSSAGASTSSRDSSGHRLVRPGADAAARPHRHLRGSDDRFFEPAVVEEMWRRWGRPAIRWYPGSHMGFLVRLPDAIAEARRFIDEYLVGAHGG